MQRRIDLGEDKNLFIPDPKTAGRPQMTFLMDDIAKSANDAMDEARNAAWDRWVNSEPLVFGHVDEGGAAYLFHISEKIRGRVILMDVWDYTLLPCRRSLTYVLEWHRRYSPAGLVTIGVHAPRFEFGKDKKFIADAARGLGVTYPIALDNDFEIWRSLENRYWPRRVLFDGAGQVRADFAGEGGYPEFEAAIQTELRRLSPGLACAPVMKPARRADQPGYQEDEATTSEIFLGTAGGARIAGNLKPVVAGEEIPFQDDGKQNYEPGVVHFDGPWIAAADSMHGSIMHKSKLKLTVKFTATDAYLVARSRPKNSMDIPQLIRPQILVDRRPLPDEHLGADALMNEYHRSIMMVRDPRLHHIASNLDFQSHELSIQVDTDGNETLEVYGLFFEDRR